MPRPRQAEKQPRPNWKASAAWSYFNVEVVTADNKVFDVKVDAADGKVLSSKADTADRGGKDEEDEKD